MVKMSRIKRYKNFDEDVRIPLFIDTSNRTTTEALFMFCSKLITLPLLDLSNVLNANSMFRWCQELRSVPAFDTHQLESANSMFLGCRSLRSLPQFDFKNLRKASELFYGCENLEYIPLIDAPKLETAIHMFRDCESLSYIPLKTFGRLTELYGTFENTGLREVDLTKFDTSNIQNYTQTFARCEHLEKAKINIENVSGFQGVFRNCTKLREVELLSGKQELCNMSGSFESCYRLEKLVIEASVRYLDVSWTNLSPKAADLLLESLHPSKKYLSTFGEASIIFSRALYGKINEMLATNKGYRIVYR